MVEGSIENVKGLFLVDSGSTDNLISGSMLTRCNIGNDRLLDIPLINMKIGNGTVITTNKAVEVQIDIQGHMFMLKCVVLDTLGGVDLVLGNKALEDLRGSLDFEKHILHLKAKSIVATSMYQCNVKPGETVVIKLSARLPRFLRNADILFKPSRHLKVLQPTITAQLTRCRNYSFSICFVNQTNTAHTIKAGKVLGIVDMTYIPFTLEGMSQEGLYKIYSSTDKIIRDNLAKYPFLDKTDPNVDKTEEQILNEKIDLSQSDCTDQEKSTLLTLIHKYKGAFSIFGEPGLTEATCSFELIDKTPFRIRPYIHNHDEKIAAEKFLAKLEHMGILEKGESEYTSPVMLIGKKSSTEKRAVVDFRTLNSRIRPVNGSFPLFKESLSSIGRSEAEIYSTVDLKQAFYSMRLDSKCIPYTGVCASNSGSQYRFKHVAMGLSVSPSRFQTLISSIVREIDPEGNFTTVLLDDLLIFSKRKDHMKHIELVFQKMQEAGLKLSPEKCQLFRRKVTYLGHDLSFVDNRPCITAMRQKCQEILKMKPPKCRKSCKRFIGAITFLSMYLDKLAILLQPFHELTKLKSQFIWTELHETNFRKIRELIVQPPVLVLPNNKDPIRVYCDSSRTGCGHAVFQISDGIERLVAFGSRTFHKAVLRYSVTELELTGLLVGFNVNRIFLDNVPSFEAIVDHSALIHIMKAKHKPPTLRIAKLLEKLSYYRFSLGYKSGTDKNMVLVDFLSRLPEEDDFDSIADMTPVTYSCLHVNDGYDVTLDSQCNVVTRSQSKA